MLDLSKGRYWDFGWQLIDGCTPCSPGCDNCWSAGMTHRFGGKYGRLGSATIFTTEDGNFDGTLLTHPERLSVPLKRKKPAVYAIWNDLFHEDVPDSFIGRVFSTALGQYRHTFLILTKRPQRMASLLNKFYAGCEEREIRKAINIWHGLTVCNQQEADEKIPVFQKVPGKKFLSHEPALERINYGESLKYIDCLISGAETGVKARPSDLDIFRSDRYQCKQTGTAFFLKHISKKAGRILDGATHDDLPWRKQ